MGSPIMGGVVWFGLIVADRGEDPVGSPDPGQALCFGVAPVLMTRSLPTHKGGVKVCQFGSGQTVRIHATPDDVVTVGVELGATLGDIAGDPYGAAGLEVGCLGEECHQSGVGCLWYCSR